MPTVLQPSEPTYLAPRTEFLLDWSLKVLGVASAILFGIWAPISYKATANGNADNNASQDSLVSRLDEMNEQASSASSLQSSALYEARSAALALSAVRAKMNGLATLKVWEFCDGRAGDVRACSELSAAVTIDEVITSLVGNLSPTSGNPGSSNTPTLSSIPPRSTTASSRATNTPSPVGSATSRGVSVPLAAILGIVFGGLALLGLILGVLVSRKRMKNVREGI
ncbi:hypothetical protein BU26DRAFT_547169 [Trematosphaeria pertusa]|uniref:Uncharacterized protein n=1 Tax=Trematosphaeria pertusa TaxID=390896 RepID=A0A6A6IZX8_9PLEO|nr:uncharacterized protein BU26DRAFT_547169 [Trematosphaeria pertusa]KAF2255140.1 hypothetical protein BU26DRAFT_547169 [Trematosphaeria pertusa]